MSTILTIIVMKRVKYTLYKFLFILSPLLFSSLNPDLSKTQKERLEDREARYQKQLLRELSKT